MKAKRKSSYQAWAFVAPMVLLVCGTAFWPLLRTFRLAFTDATLSSRAQAHWIGLENFQFLFWDSDFWGSVWNTVVFSGLSVSFELALGLAAALLLNESFRGRSLARAAMLVPWAIPTVVSAKLWAWMFNDLYGVINAFLLKLSIIQEPVAWLADPRLSLFTIIFVDVWKSTPFVALLLLAGLQSIPVSLYEAARLEGGSAWRIFTSITLPLLWPAILIAAIFRTLDALRVFDLPFILTSNTRSTRVMSIFARQQLIDFQDTGYGSAASILIFCVIGVFVVMYLAAGKESLGLDK